MKNILASYDMRNASACFQHLNVLTFQKIIFYVPTLVLKAETSEILLTIYSENAFEPN